MHQKSICTIKTETCMKWSKAGTSTMENKYIHIYNSPVIWNGIYVVIMSMSIYPSTSGNGIGILACHLCIQVKHTQGPLVIDSTAKPALQNNNMIESSANKRSHHCIKCREKCKHVQLRCPSYL